MKTTTCITAADLMRLLRRESTPSEQAALREHADGCTACERLLRDLGANATLLNAPAPPSQPQEADTHHGRSLADTLGVSIDARTSAAACESAAITQLGGYRILQPLGSGGMGAVYLAEDVALNRRVALKVMHPALQQDATARERFLREARSAAKLKSDRIVTIYQVGVDAGTPFLAMELLAGESLEQRLTRTGRFDWPKLVRIGRQIAEGLSVAHAEGVIHRDVKPANIWLEECPNEPSGSRVKLLDFGLARCAQSNSQLSGSGQMIGTPQYMAPEQALGQSIDARADLFSLGCVLYRMATGLQAFPGDSVLAVLTALATREPPPLDQLRVDAPAGLSALVHRLMAKQAAERPASAAAVARELAEIERGFSSSRPATVSTRSNAGAKSRWTWIAAGVAAILVAVTLIAARNRPATPAAAGEPPIRVGVLFSTTGTLAESGEALVDATTLAIEEVNASGGIEGRRLEPVFRDGQSDPAVYAAEAERLIADDKVCVIFGCWTSASRKAVKEVVEKRSHLLLYPLQYEGLEQSPNIVYLGAAPNQQIRPAVKHFYAYLNKRRFFLVGSDYVFPRAANAILRDELKQLGAEVAGEMYLPLGSPDVADIIAAIQKSRPDVILNTINGDSNYAFFRALRQTGITPEKIPTVSFSISEHEMRGLSPRDMAGDYAAWNYFQSVDRLENRRFVERFQARFGKLRVTSDPMEAAYTGVHLWAESARAAGSTHPSDVLPAIKGRTFNAPEGAIRIDPVTQHMHKHFRLGRIKTDGQFEIVMSTENLIAPEPFPSCRPRAEWESFLNDMQRGWGGRWERPTR